MEEGPIEYTLSLSLSLSLSVPEPCPVHFFILHVEICKLFGTNDHHDTRTGLVTHMLRSQLDLNFGRGKTESWSCLVYSRFLLSGISKSFGINNNHV